MKLIIKNNNAYKINIKNKPCHPIFEIQKDIENLYIYRFMLMKNICSNNKTGYNLIVSNNKHYINIENIMKRLIKNTKVIKKFDLEISDNVTFIKYDILYTQNDNDYDYNYDTTIVKDSLYYGINNFIYFVIELLKGNYDNKLILILKLLDLYKKIIYNLNIVNMTLDKKKFFYVSDIDKKYISTNKLLIKIYIKYNLLHKVKNQDVTNPVKIENNKSIELCNNNYKNVLYPKIYILNKYNNKYEKRNGLSTVFVNTIFRNNFSLQQRRRFLGMKNFFKHSNKYSDQLSKLFHNLYIHIKFDELNSILTIFKIYRFFINVKKNNKKYKYLKKLHLSHLQKIKIYLYITFVYVKKKKKDINSIIFMLYI